MIAETNASRILLQAGKAAAGEAPAGGVHTRNSADLVVDALARLSEQIYSLHTVFVDTERTELLSRHPALTPFKK